MIRKTILTFLSLGLAFGCGVAVGYRLLLRPHLWMGAVGESFAAGQYAQTQYLEASYPQAQQALEAYIGYLQRQRPSERSTWEPGDNPWLDARGLRFDETLTWSRLALLHERNRNRAASDQAWKRAEALASQGSWRDPSRENLRHVVERLDRSTEPSKPSLMPTSVPRGA